MARMFPADPGSFTTSGEAELFHFLKQALRPDSLFTAWYSPDIKDREPDFIVLSPDSGLIVLEVKDWLASQILEADPKYVLLQIGARQERRHQPLAQAKEYVHSLMSLLSKRHPLQDDGRSKPPCPVCGGAVFPHMRREEFHAAGLYKVMDEDRILFWDEVRKDSSFLKDPSGQSLRHWLQKHFPPRFPFQLSPELLAFIKSAIFPIVRIETPVRGILSPQKELVRLLDHEQENLARSFGKGKTLIQGPAGSGKTLVLSHQAWNLPRVDKNIHRILFTCFNLSLPQYIQRLLSKKFVSMGSNSVEVLPFYMLCGRILGEKLAHSGEESDYYKLVTQETLDRLAGDHELKNYWDAILVDEGQDFSPEMTAVILKLVGDKSSLYVAEDENQVLYGSVGSSWEKIAGMEKRQLSRQYRNTWPIASLAAKLIGVTPPHNAGSRGSSALWLTAPNPISQIEQLADQVTTLAQHGCPLNDIAILYAAQSAELPTPFPELMQKALEKRGILACWLSKDSQSKRAYDITTEKVAISTIHSAKGMDFAHVFLLGLDLLKDTEKNRRLAYVGITRAREELAFSNCTEGGLMPALRQAQV